MISKDEAIKMLREALKNLHDDDMDYIKLNHLGAENNHPLVTAREALEATTDIQEDPNQWVVTHNGQSVSADKLTKAIGLARSLMTEDEKTIAAENLMRAVEEELAMPKEPTPEQIRNAVLEEAAMINVKWANFNKGDDVYRVLTLVAEQFRALKSEDKS